MSPWPFRLTPRRLIVTALLASLLGWATVSALNAWRYDGELSRAEREIASGQFAAARERLARLAKRWPGLDEVEYPLGVCEASLGHVDAALAAWARVPIGSVVGPRAALQRARFAIAHGRLAEAERSLATVLGKSGEVGDTAAKLADQVDLYAGRSREIVKRAERRWATVTDRLALLRTHWLLDTQPYPAEAVRQALDKMGQESPDDDRVWLGQADLATRTGQFDQADDWLKRCEKRRPQDHDVLLDRLDWALASRRPDAAIETARRLSANDFEPAEVAALAVRLAEVRGDDAAEREALKRRVEIEPGDASAWGRLADLATDPETSAKARKRKAEIDHATDLYRMMMGKLAEGDSSRVADLARTAEILNRRFEARGWWTLLARTRPDDPEPRLAFARLSKPGPSTPGPSPLSLADLLPGSAGKTGKQAEPIVASGSNLVVPTFRDIADSSGLKFVYDNDRTPLRRLPETMGGGLGLLDYDGDGLLDVYAVQGGHFPAPETVDPSGGDRLFRNRGDGTFEDVTERSRISLFRRGFGHGVTVGDYDNDGDPDLFVTRWRSYALYRNRGDGTFEDVTSRSGLDGDRGWPTSSAFADLDNDGDLDLYVCQYLEWDPKTSDPCIDPDRPGQHLYCVPRAFKAEPDRVFRNDGGRFVDVSAESGIASGDVDGRGLGVVVADLDDDGKPDIFVANDMSANLLYHNLGGFKFEEIGQQAGAASNGDGGYQAGMGIACGDVDGDGRPDLAVTNFYGESTTLYQNLGGGLFADRTAAFGLAAPTRYVLGFGATFLDADNDGRLDLAIANGHVNDYAPAIPYAMPAQLFLNTPNARFVEVSRRAGDCWQVGRVGRGLAAGDVDNDGRLDVLILSQAGPLACFRNLGTPGVEGRRLTLRLEGTASNRDGVGALVRVTSGVRTQTAQRLGGGSFLSASDGRLHFGLGRGEGSDVAAVEVRWPSGKVGRHDALKADAAYRIVEGEPTPRPLVFPSWSSH